jgi:hypothetical protein
MGTKYTVQGGDCATSIAAKNGFATYHDVYDHADNADLRKHRPNPNLLAPGDVLVIPYRKPKTLLLATGKKHTIVLKRPKAELRLNLHDLVGKKLAGASFRLTLASKTIFGASDANGLVKAPIPPELTTASLEIDLPKPPSPQDAASDGLVLPKETFALPTTAEDGTKDYKPLTKLIWTLSIGDLGPADAIKGVQRRLHNLGFAAAITGVNDAPTGAALRAFQETRKIKVSGTLDDAIRDELVKVHDQGAA